MYVKTQYLSQPIGNVMDNVIPWAALALLLGFVGFIIVKTIKSYGPTWMKVVVSAIWSTLGLGLIGAAVIYTLFPSKIDLIPIKPANAAFNISDAVLIPTIALPTITPTTSPTAFLPPTVTQTAAPETIYIVKGTYSVEVKEMTNTDMTADLGTVAESANSVVAAYQKAVENMETSKADMAEWSLICYGEKGKIGVAEASLKNRQFLSIGTEYNGQSVLSFYLRLKKLREDGAIEAENAFKLEEAAKLLEGYFNLHDDLCIPLTDIENTARIASGDYSLVDQEKVAGLFARAKELETQINTVALEYNKRKQESMPSLNMLQGPNGESFVEYLEKAYPPEQKDVYITATPAATAPQNIVDTLLPPTATATSTPEPSPTPQAPTPTPTSQNVKLQTPQPAAGCYREGTEGRTFLGTFNSLWDIYQVYLSLPVSYVGEYAADACGEGFAVSWTGEEAAYIGPVWALVRDVPINRSGKLYIKLIPRPEDPFFGWKWVLSNASGGESDVVILERLLPPTPTAIPDAPICNLPPEGFTEAQKDTNPNWQSLVFSGTMGKAKYSRCGNEYLFVFYPDRNDENFARWWFTSPFIPPNIGENVWFWVEDPDKPGGCTSRLETDCVVAFPR